MEIIHQTEATDLAWVDKAYRDMGIKVRVRSFFDDMAEVRRQAPLICRAGGITLSELSRLGIPAIMIPFGAPRTTIRWRMPAM